MTATAAPLANAPTASGLPAPNLPSPDQSIAAEHLRAFVERIERLNEEKAGLTSDIRDVFAEAKGNGFDTKALRKIIAFRKMDQAQRAEEEAILDLYLQAMGMM